MPIEKFYRLELSLIESPLGIAGAQVQVTQTTFLSPSHGPRHHGHPEMAARIGQVIERIVVIGHPRRLEVEQSHSPFGSITTAVPEHQQVGNHPTRQESVQARRGHNTRTEAGLSKGQPGRPALQR